MNTGADHKTFIIYFHQHGHFKPSKQEMKTGSLLATSRTASYNEMDVSFNIHFLYFPKGQLLIARNG